MNIEQQRDLLAAALDRAMGMIRAYANDYTRPRPHCDWVINLCNEALNSIEPQHLFKLREVCRIFGHIANYYSVEPFGPIGWDEACRRCGSPNYYRRLRWWRTQKHVRKHW